MLIELSLCGSDCVIEVIVIKSRIDDFKTSVTERGWFDTAGNGMPAVEKKDFHYFFFVPENFPDAS